MAAEGHQIASHTWSRKYLCSSWQTVLQCSPQPTDTTKSANAGGHNVDENFSAISDTQARNQMLWNEIAFNDILGYIPTYMRFVVSPFPFTWNTK